MSEIKNIYLIRHGKTESNNNFCHQGPNEPINDFGKQQVKELAEFLAPKKLDVIISSDYLRAKQTAEAISDLTNLSIREEPAFRELIRPNYLTDKNYFSLSSLKYFLSFYLNLSNGVWKGGDAESLEEIRVRSVNAKRLLENMPEQNIAVVTHCFFMDVFIETVCSTKLPKTRRLLKRLIGQDAIPNTGLFHFKYNAEAVDNQCAWEQVKFYKPPYDKIS